MYKKRTSLLPTLHRHLGIKSTARVSMNFTTTKEEIDTFIEKLEETIDFLKFNS